MPRTKNNGEKGINKIPFSQKQWESFAVYADGHKWFLMLPPEKYSVEELAKWPALADIYEEAIAARAEYNNSLIELSETFGEEDEDEYSKCLEDVHTALEEARRAEFEFDETAKMANRMVHNQPAVAPLLFPDDYDADERDEDDGIRKSVTLDDDKKVWAVDNAPTKPTLSKFTGHVYIRPDGRGKIAKDFTAAKTPITKPAKPLGEWGWGSSLPSDDDEEEEEVDLTKVVDSSNVTLRRGQKAPRDEEEHKHSDGNRKRASEYTPKSASKNKKKKNGKDEVDDDDDDAREDEENLKRERLRGVEHARRRDEGDISDEGDDDEDRDRPEIDSDEADGTPINRATPDQLIRELKSRNARFSVSKGDVKREECDEENKQFIKQAYVAYRRTAFCRYKPGDMPDPCIEGDEGDEGDAAAEEEEEDSEGSEDSQRPGYDKHGLLIDKHALVAMKRSGHGSRGGAPSGKSK